MRKRKVAEILAGKFSGCEVTGEFFSGNVPKREPSWKFARARVFCERIWSVIVCFRAD